MSATRAPAPALERVGRCGAVGSWSPGEGRPRVPWRCKCEGFARSVELSTTPVYPTCTCSHSKAVHALVEVTPDAVRTCDRCGAVCDSRVQACECGPECPYPAVARWHGDAGAG